MSTDAWEIVEKLADRLGKQRDVQSVTTRHLDDGPDRLELVTRDGERYEVSIVRKP